MSAPTSLATPTISVLMSCRNGGRWLRAACDSVLAQTFEDFEFVLIDDGSTDETWNIIESYRDQDERIVAISKENTGLADSLNVGIAQAKGEWIARLDADDMCERTRLEEQVRYVREHPSMVLVGSGCVEVGEGGDVVKTHAYPSEHRALLRHLVRVQQFFPHSSAFYQRAAVRSVGCYRPRMRRAQDWDLWLRLSEVGQIGCLHAPLVRIRKHAGQISHGDSGRRQICDCRAGVVSYLLRRRGLPDPVEGDVRTWSSFLPWLEQRLEREGFFDARRAYGVARTALVGHGNRAVGSIAFVICVVRSGHAFSLVRDRLVGSGLPRRLANEWAKMSATNPPER